MAIERLAQDLYIVPGLVNVYLLETNDGLALLDTGFPGGKKKILDAIREIGRKPTDVKHIILSHCHPDHIGNAAALKAETGATVWAHPIDAPLIEAGSTGRRPMFASPGLRNRLMTKVLSGRLREVPPTKVDRLLEHGDSPFFAPDLEVIHAPGHSAGQIALLWRRRGGILFVADTCVNRGGFKMIVATEDPDLARETLRKLAQYDFESVCVMHGKPVMAGGGRAFRQATFAR
ncbi:MAG: MBL fold metallo-hydrolase [Sphingomicrobium sp.]